MSTRRVRFRTGLTVVASLLLASGLLWATGMMGNRMMGNGMMRGGMMGGSMIRHRQWMMGGVPGEYRGRSNPLPAGGETEQQGRELYQANCAACHGEQGYGDGPAASGLSPPPANINRLMRMPMMAGDDYLFWTISEGGAALGTAMPAFRESLDEQARWAIIRYLRQLP